MTGNELCEFLQRVYGARWSGKVSQFGGAVAVVDFFDALPISGLSRFSKRLGLLVRVFPVRLDCVPTPVQVGMVLDGQVREALGIPDLMGMVEMLRTYRGVVLPLDHPAFYWFKTMVLHRFDQEWLDSLMAAEDVGIYLGKLKPVYAEVMKQVEAGHCLDYPQFVERELHRLDRERERRACLYRPRTDADVMAKEIGLKMAYKAVQG